MHLEIPEPCHENWQNMSHNEKGRFCDKCCKVVVDFTNMATEKVIEFISGKREEYICGRFRPDQLFVPVEKKQNKFKAQRVKVFLAALFLVFGGALFTGCKTHEEKMGKVESNLQDDTIHHLVGALPPARDTTIKNHPHSITKGRVNCVISDTIKTHQQMPLGGPKLIPEKQQPMMGKPSINPKDSI